MTLTNSVEGLIWDALVGAVGALLAPVVVVIIFLIFLYAGGYSFETSILCMFLVLVYLGRPEVGVLSGFFLFIALIYGALIILMAFLKAINR
jgi:hypothetical protein